MIIICDKLMALEYHKPIKILLASCRVLPYHLPTLSSPWHMHHRPSQGYLVKVGGGTSSPTPQCFSLKAQQFLGGGAGRQGLQSSPCTDHRSRGDSGFISPLHPGEIRVPHQWVGRAGKMSHCLSVQTVYFQQECTCVSPHLPLGQTLLTWSNCVK